MGPEPRGVAAGGPRGRRRHGQGASAGRRAAGHRGADRLLVLDRELEPLRERGRGADGHVRPADRRARRPSWTTRTCACASSAAATGVSEELQEKMDWAERTTADNTRITLFVAFNYGGRAEIVDAARTFTDGDESDFARLLYAPDMHDPDLLIRTSGEQRISNYLLWQCAYSEFVFRDELWPDFTHRGVRGVAGRVRPPQAPLRGEVARGRPDPAGPVRDPAGRGRDLHRHRRQGGVRRRPGHPGRAGAERAVRPDAARPARSTWPAS